MPMQSLAAVIIEPLPIRPYHAESAALAAADGLSAAAAETRERSRTMSGIYGKLDGIVRAADLDLLVLPVLGRLVIAVRHRSDDRHPEVAIEFAAILAGFAVESLLHQPAPARLVHGALAYGPGDTAGGGLLGPVFDEASACASRSASAALWLAPSALAVYAAGSVASIILGDHDVPMADGGTFPTKAVRLRLDPAAQAAFTARANAPGDLDQAIIGAASLRHLAWCAGGARRPG